ncbi:glycoside hydrolase family 53 protein [Phytohabitans sp. LJ34]|uniref:glycoside hydrolase family 53 protein n=1 Tax=Phytohabitans sp. LJ34 TaxID=3452217 RepID=UPI003F8953D6
MRLFRLVAVAVSAALVGGFLGNVPARASGGGVRNAGFEDGLAGWATAGAASAEEGGHTGTARLTLSAAAEPPSAGAGLAPASLHGPGPAEATQRVSGLARGTYTLRAWVRGGGAAAVSLDCGGPGRDVAVPRTGPELWVQVAVDARVTSGRCQIRLTAASGWAHVDDVTLARGALDPVRIKGADISHLTKNEDYGAVYRDHRGRPGDAVRILRDNGVNLARLKVWVDPADGYNSKARVLAMAKRAKARGMRLLIDFHYSDAWADPGKQNKPAAWADLPFDGLRQALYDHTYDVISALRQQGTPADMAQVGNEINGGLLWPDGRWDNWDGLAALLTAGSNAVKAASPSTKVVLHLAEGGNNGGHVWWFDNAIARGVPFDVIGLSHYVYWHGPLGALQANLFDLSTRYGKPIALVETAYGFTLEENDHEANIFNAALEQAGGYPATPQGQADALRDMFNVVAAVPGTLGVVYWEPTWTAVDGAGWDPADPTSGDGWENQAVFDYSGRALPALKVFGRF